MGSRLTMKDIGALPERYQEQVRRQMAEQSGKAELAEETIPDPPELQKDKRGYVWSGDAEAWLRRYYPRFGKLWCSLMFGVPEGVIRSKASKLKLKSGYRAAVIRAIGTKPTGDTRSKQSDRQKEVWKGDVARRRALGRSVAESFDRNGHPKGFQGHEHTEGSRQQMGDSLRRRWNDPKAKWNSAEFRRGLARRASERQLGGNMDLRPTNAKGGKRKDLGQFFRSAWEANYARYLNFLVASGEVIRWEYECKTFKFEKISRGVMSYTPDFRVEFPDGRVEWHEVKGWLTQRGKTALNRMRKYYPEEVLLVIDRERYRAIARSVRVLIPNWE